MASIIGKLSTFFSEVKSETKKVDWPTREQTVRYVLIVVGLSFAVAVFLGSIDYAFTRFLNFIISKRAL